MKKLKLEEEQGARDRDQQARIDELEQQVKAFSVERAQKQVLHNTELELLTRKVKYAEQKCSHQAKAPSKALKPG